MGRFLTYLVLISAFASCRKDSETALPPPAGGSWSFDGTGYTAAYSETDDRHGFRLIFADAAGANSIGFRFRSRPSGPGTFTASSDTSASNAVSIYMTASGTGYHSAGGTRVTVDLASGKLRLDGTGVPMTPDSAGSPARLDFSLREF